MINGIFIALVVLDALALWAIVVSKGWWIPKLVAIFVVACVNFLVWSGINSGIGWPTTSNLPTAALFDSCVIDEPDQATNDPGAIYVWATPLQTSHGVFAYTSRGFEPRSYQQPYTRQLHLQCLKAEKATQQGEPVGVGKATSKKQAQNPKALKGPRGHRVPVSNLHFYPLPPPHLPRKRQGQG